MRLALTMLLCLVPLGASAQDGPSDGRLERLLASWSEASSRPAAPPTLNGRPLEEARLPDLRELWCRTQPPSCECGGPRDGRDGHTRQIQRRLRRCYENRLHADPNGPSGRVVFEITLDRDGRASAVRVTEDTTEDPRLVRCMVRALRVWWVGPGYHAEVSATVTLPIVFSAPAPEAREPDGPAPTRERAR